MAFSGTLDKCKACDKTVHVVDVISADGVSYHKTCFKCSHCNGLLVMSSYSSMDGVLYCKTHFEQLFKESGNFGKSFQNGKPEQKNALTKSPSRISYLFSGTQDKCGFCKKTVYPLEKLSVEGECYHKSCFRCSRGGCFLTLTNYAALDGILYCRIHFAQMFKEKGCYNNNLTKSASKKISAASEEEKSDNEESKPTSEEPKSDAEGEANEQSEEAGRTQS